MKRFQAEYANEIPTPTGYVGPLTRNIIKTLTCGTTNKTTTTTTPTSPVATNYNPSDAWWLNPAQTAPGATDPSKTTTTPTLTSTTTPPNCEQYAGKMPIVGQTYRVEQREFAKMVLNSMYSFSAEAQRDLDQMQGDIGLAPFRMGATSNNRIEIPVNTVLSYKMKTTDYNFPIEHYIGGSSHPGSGEGSIIWSISQCPGDFTSPGMITNPDVSNPGAQYSNIYGPCLSVGSQIASGVIFNSAGGPCTLEKNKTYYVNVAVISLIKSSDGGGLSIDIVDYARVLKPTVAANTMWLDVIKNRTAFYTDMRSAQAQMSAVAQARVTACRTAIGDARPDYVRTGGECSNLPSPTSIFTWQ